MTIRRSGVRSGHCFSFIVFADESADFLEVRHVLLDLLGAELDFNQGVAPVLEMKHRVGLKSVAIPVIGQAYISTRAKAL